MTLLPAFFFALSAAIVVMTIAQTASSYRSLPMRVAMSLNYDGSERGQWPRPMIWLLVIVQVLAGALLVFAGYAIAAKAPGTHGSLLGLSIVAVCINAVMWRVQKLLISVAQSGGTASRMGGFLLFVVACFAAILIDAIAIH